MSSRNQSIPSLCFSQMCSSTAGSLTGSHRTAMVCRNCIIAFYSHYLLLTTSTFPYFAWNRSQTITNIHISATWKQGLFSNHLQCLKIDWRKVMSIIFAIWKHSWFPSSYKTDIHLEPYRWLNIGKFTILPHNISYLVCLNEFKLFLLIKCKSVVQYFLTDNYFPLWVVLLLLTCLYFFLVSLPFLFMLSCPPNQEFSFEKNIHSCECLVLKGAQQGILNGFHLYLFAFNFFPVTKHIMALWVEK